VRMRVFGKGGTMVVGLAHWLAQMWEFGKVGWTAVDWALWSARMWVGEMDRETVEATMVLKLVAPMEHWTVLALERMWEVWYTQPRCTQQCWKLLQALPQTPRGRRRWKHFPRCF